MNRKPSRVLVADDDADIRSVICSTLAMLGVDIEEVSDGEAALAACKRQLPDVAVLDITMPGMTGLEVCRELKALTQGAHVPVLMLTARAGLQDKVDALDDGADDYLTKPFHYQELQARVRALLRVRELTVRLAEKNLALEQLQQRLIEQERQLVASQLGGTAAHKMGQPLAAILLNCHLLELMASEDSQRGAVLAALKHDAQRLNEILTQLRTVDASKTEEYHDGTKILNLLVKD